MSAVRGYDARRRQLVMGLFDHMDDDRRRQFLGVLLLFVGLLVMVSLGSHVYLKLSGNIGPAVGAAALGIQNRVVSTHLFELLGIVAWALPMLLIMWGWNRIVDGEAETLALRSVFLFAVSLLVVTLIHVVGGARMMNISGLAGAFLSDLGTQHIGRVGTFLAGLGGVILITLLTTEFDIEALTEPFVRIGEVLADWARSFADWMRSFIESLFDREERTPPRVKRAKRTKRSREADRPERTVTARRKRREIIEEEPATAPPPRAVERPPERPRRAPTIVQQRTRRAAAAPKARRTASYKLPSISLLDDPPSNVKPEVSRDELLMRSKMLEEKLSDFGVAATVAQVQPGPIITRFEVEPARGVKVSQIANLQDDLALAMRATAIRIIAPIPGKGAVGIEIPNANPAVVYLKETLAANAFQNLTSEIPLALGKDTTGKVYCSDLAKMPHLLVAGATGSGKSICLNALITGILFRSTPDEVRFLMIDPKRLELTRYADIPHLLTPVVTDAKSAAMALQWLVGEMDRRYDILSLLGVRDVYGFNARIADKDEIEALKEDDRRKLPHVVVVVDEFADLMVRAPREVEAPV
ncbi:hypothetical protein K8S17_04780, partial [bacterium]|nr:hypothetical protein [bacterium]